MGSAPQPWTEDPEPEIVEPGTRDPAHVARAIDSLEKHLEKYGSIVPRHADVWGQARLMMHRQEFERVMRADVYNFQPSLQAAISSSDQAFLANALSLQAGVVSTGAPTDPVSLLASPNDAVAREKLVRSGSLSNYVTPTGKLALEPSLLEDQKKRYLDHLNELRRINEGDDNTDAPGYALNLVRLPVSVLSGSCTQTGCGAECTVTASLHLTDDLLPQTYRNLVVNDIVGLLTLPLTRIIEVKSEAELQKSLDAYQASEKDPAGGPDRFKEATRKIYGELSDAFAGVTPSSPRHLNQAPVPASQIYQSVGAHNMAYLAQQLRQTFKDHPSCDGSPYHLDVQASLANELGGAYLFLSEPRAEHLWQYCSPELVDAIRTQNLHAVITIQNAFFHDYEALVDTKDLYTRFDTRRSITAILAWAIIIDSALLNQRFAEDMRSTQAARGCPVAADGWLPLYLPHPPLETCRLFNDYVRCRWPMFVFALDPETEDQNVGDSFSLRREQQLALSVAFTSGRISARNFTRYVRRIEQDIDTIALNRTMIGFSHGDDTFGWRFYPRVQTPPIDGNLQALFRDLFMGGFGPEHELKRRRLENGPRECVALIIMPNFVPYVDLEVTGNWFRLADPKCKLLDLKQTMRFSRSVKSIQDTAPAVCDNGKYRPGDVALMLRRLEQLSQRLPLQAQLVNVPFENTHGGFELLCGGVTDLAPQLFGWYGAPGINPNGDTSLFLVGDNFSVHQTRVLIGGQALDPSCPAGCAGARDPLECHCTKSKAPEMGKVPEEPCVPLMDRVPASSRSVGPEVATVVQAGCDCRTAPQPKPMPHTTIVTAPGSTPAAARAADAKVAAADAKAAAADAKASAAANKPAAADAKGTASPTDPKVAAADAKVAATDAKVAAADSKAAAADAKAAAADAAAQATSLTSAGKTLAYEVPHFQVELLSRQVMRVTIPRGVYSQNGKVDVHIATPYGVSPHLAIPILCPAPSTPAAPTVPPAVPPADSAVAAEKSKMTITHTWEGPMLVGDRMRYGYGYVRRDGTLRINWQDTTGSGPKVVDVRITFTVGTTKVPIIVPNLIANDGYFELNAEQAENFASQLMSKLQAFDYTPDKPIPAWTSTSIEVLPHSDSPQPVSVNSTVTVEFQAIR
jgi:hypothetical protein